MDVASDDQMLHVVCCVRHIELLSSVHVCHMTIDDRLADRFDPTLRRDLPEDIEGLHEDLWDVFDDDDCGCCCWWGRWYHVSL